jgi:hypothetical protein
MDHHSFRAQLAFSIGFAVTRSRDLLRRILKEHAPDDARQMIAKRGHRAPGDRPGYAEAPAAPLARLGAGSRTHRFDAHTACLESREPLI